ncbi:hypothetical protein NAC36_002508 [Staphylococcus pseudintermedius]|uniref:hypothetical protein n=5 Tax=Staphylococcus pseudintermedius TaxID=283734 RepID=UPI000CFBC032|nr:hypothetical protein [Staphylococcus pseudintermedius]EGQ2902091.1 hypothetical protein [Staphylococcus pseudintermedius]EGQ3076432.1 hypothetical protein [Staphylococcus pseudintermedius]EGQ3318966.1 hypothetical protein [Staphylococcus pseudintermedius]EGQ3375149.1 hypothetical protein [Staphylococcus pseudintermedius]EGQ3382617.1 hypothetical protein [Staphylococcus pseudintermedius]
MSNIPNNLTTLENSINLNNVELFESFDIKSFLNGKRLAVEKIFVDSHIKLELRIIEDNTIYSETDEIDEVDANKDKVITTILHEDIANKINIVDIIGNEVIINNINPDDVLVYGINCLQLTVKDIVIKDYKIEGFKQRNNITKVDYRLMKMNRFKTFNTQKFLSSYDMRLLTVYPQNPTTARAIILITNDLINSEFSNVGKTFSIKVNLAAVRDIPLEFLIGNKTITFNDISGNLTGMTVKNNQVLLTADNLQITVNGQKVILGIDTNNKISNNFHNS